MASPRRVDELHSAWAGAPTPEAELLFYRCLRDDAGAICRTVLGEAPPELANDIATAALLKSPQFRGEAKFSTWFYRLARNRCMDYLRAKQRERRLVADENLEELENFAGALTDPDARLLLDRILEWLTDEERELLLGKLHNEEDAVLAEKLGTPHDNIKRRWFKLRAKLRELLKTD